MAKVLGRKHRKMTVNVDTVITPARYKSKTLRRKLKRNKRWGKKQNLKRTFRYV